MKTPKLGDVLFKRDKDNIPLGFIIEMENGIEVFNFETRKIEIKPKDSGFNGTLMSREEIKKSFPSYKNLQAIISLIGLILNLKDENSSLRNQTKLFLNQQKED